MIHYRSLNQVTLIGRLGRNAELKTSGETSFVTFSLATSSSVKKPDGTWEHPTQWHNVALFGKLGATLAKNLTKGTLVAVQGAIVYRDVERDGSKVRYTDIRAEDVQLLEKAEAKARPADPNDVPVEPVVGQTMDF